MTHAQIAAERKRSNSQHAMLDKDTARNIGAVTATRVGGRRNSRTYSRASECISYYATDRSDAVIFRESSVSKRARALRSVVLPPAHRITAADLAPILDSNH